MARLPRPPAKGGKSDAGPPPNGAALSIPAPAAVHPGFHALTKHDAKFVNLDNGTHMDARGTEHQTHPGNKPQVGPLTIVFASKMGHPPMRFGDHARQGTDVHKRMRGRGKPALNHVAKLITKQMALPKRPAPAEGSPAEERAESPAERTREAMTSG